jgi:hypothetical protein
MGYLILETFSRRHIDNKKNYTAINTLLIAMDSTVIVRTKHLGYNVSVDICFEGKIKQDPFTYLNVVLSFNYVVY